MQQLEPLAKGSIAVATSAVTKMKANCADTPYVFERSSGECLCHYHESQGS